jgi:hypothetical protein
MSRTPLASRNPLIPFALIGGLLTVASACDINTDFDETVTRQFDLAEFDSVAIDAPFDVTIRQGETQQVEIEVGERSVDNLIVEVTDGELRIDLDASFNFNNLVATITVTDLTSVHASSASDVVLPDLDLDHLILDADEASHLRTSGEIDDLNLSLSGASSADLVGTEITSVDLDFSGASSAEFDDSVEEVQGSISGASDLSVAETTNVRVETSGAASVDREG